MAAPVMDALPKNDATNGKVVKFINNVRDTCFDKRVSMALPNFFYCDNCPTRHWGYFNRKKMCNIHDTCLKILDDRNHKTAIPDGYFEAFEKLVILPGIESRGKDGDSIYLCSKDSPADLHKMIEDMKDVIITRQFNGKYMPNGLISFFKEKNNINFYLRNLWLESSEITPDELKLLYGFGTLEYLHLNNVTITDKIEFSEMNKSLKNVKKLYLNVKNMKFNQTWPKEFTEHRCKFEALTLCNLPNNVEPNLFYKFIKAQDETMKHDCVHLNFSMKIEPKKFAKKTLNGLYKKVNKDEFDAFKTNQKFIVDVFKPDEKKNDEAVSKKNNKRSYHYVEENDAVEDEPAAKKMKA